MQTTNTSLQCSIIGCDNRKKPGVTLHSFPRNDALRKLWLRAVGRENWQPDSKSRVCSDHFSEGDVHRTYIGPQLRENSVPSIFPARPDNSKRFKFKIGPIMSRSSKHCKVDPDCDPDPVEMRKCSVVLHRLPLEGDTTEEKDTSCSPSKKSPGVDTREIYSQSKKSNTLGDGPTSNSNAAPSLLRCCVPGCKNGKRKMVVGVTYHRFPDNPVRRIEWFNAVRNGDLNIKNCSEASVCSSHFDPSDLTTTKDGRTLNPGAVPSIDIRKKTKSLDAISVSSDESNRSPLESKPEPSESVVDQPVTSDSRNKPPSVSGTKSGRDDHSYYYAGGKPIIEKRIRDHPKTSKMPLVPSTKITSTPSQPCATGTSTVGSSIPAIAVQHNQLLYIYPAQLAPINSPSSGPSNIPVKTTANILVAPLNTTTPIGKVLTCTIPPRTTAPANMANSAPKKLEVPEMSDVSANMETAHIGRAFSKNPNPSTISRQQVSHNMGNYGSKPSKAKFARTKTNELIATRIPKCTQTDFIEPMKEMKKRVIEFERRTEQLEYKLAQARLKQLETSTKMSAARHGYSRSKKTIAKYKEALESRKKDIEVLEFKNKQLQVELEKLKPKPPKPRPLKVYMPTDMVGTGNNNFELVQGKPFQDGKIITFELDSDGQPNNNLEGSSSMSTPSQIPSCVSRSKYSKKRKLLPSPKITNTLPSTLPKKNPCLSSTSKAFNESGPLNVESTKADDGTIVYNLKPAAKVKQKPKSPKSVSVQIDESEFRTIETLTDAGYIAYHLLRSPQKTFPTPCRNISQNDGYQMNEDLQAVEYLGRALEGDLEE